MNLATLAFEREKEENIQNLGSNQNLRGLSQEWISEAAAAKYSYNFTWLGRPVIQYPQDLVAMQEILWKVKPDLVVETGIAHGGSLIYYASVMEVIGSGHVLGIDIDIRQHNREALEAHSMFKRISLIQGSSVDAWTVKQVYDFAADNEARRVVLVLDSHHGHDHVLKELRSYSPLVRAGSYLVVFDTIVEDLPAEAVGGRPWGKGNSPRTAVLEFLKQTDRFVVDEEIEAKLCITAAPGGYLKCVKG
jgi:cephalosporin hydroxylase